MCIHYIDHQKLEPINISCYSCMMCINQAKKSGYGQPPFDYESTLII